MFVVKLSAKPATVEASCVSSLSSSWIAAMIGDKRSM
jgi:hypothetical protein